MLSLSSEFLLLAFFALAIPTGVLLFKSFSTDKLDKLKTDYEIKNNRRDIDRNTREIERRQIMIDAQFQQPLREIYNGESNALMDANSRINVNIHLVLIEQFNKEEMKDLMFTLSIPESSCDPDAITGDMSRCIIKYMCRYQRTNELIETIKLLRKNTGL